MQIAVTHTNTDFDALASLVAATYLYPGAIGILPGQLRPNVKHFLALHRDLFRICSDREVDLEKVTGLIVVDTNNWSRLDRLALFQQRTDISIELWDHHLKGGNIEPSWKCQEQVGATITLMLREIRKRDCAFLPMHATLFLMGIYEDTGNLVYSSSKAEDAYAAGFLLENGADLDVAAAYLSSSLDGGHTDVLTSMLDSSLTHTFGGYKVGVLLVPVESGLTMLSSVVAKYKDIKGLAAAFGIFTTGSDRCMIIGCTGVQEIDVGGIMRRLGGGGHPGAGSAIVRSEDGEAVRQQVLEIIADQMNRPRTRVRDIMSQPEAIAAPTTAVREVRSLVEGARSRTALVLADGKLSGLISREECSKAKTASQLQAPVKAFMRTKIPLLRPDDVPREALRIMTETDSGVLPVVEDGRLVGVITRADLLLHIYEF
ncbi:MAG: CBS domain-containing protein [Deltaproteobacteria bacterium]|nr:CBS domain-containing protein [Deltaproteobacteria bacterium]